MIWLSYLPLTIERKTVVCEVEINLTKNNQTNLLQLITEMDFPYIAQEQKSSNILQFMGKILHNAEKLFQK